MKNGKMLGMKTAFIDRAKTALVVIDLQKGVVGRHRLPYQFPALVHLKPWHRQRGLLRSCRGINVLEQFDARKHWHEFVGD